MIQTFCRQSWDWTTFINFFVVQNKKLSTRLDVGRQIRQIDRLFLLFPQRSSCNFYGEKKDAGRWIQSEPIIWLFDWQRPLTVDHGCFLVLCVPHFCVLLCADIKFCAVELLLSLWLTPESSSLQVFASRRTQESWKFHTAMVYFSHGPHRACRPQLAWSECTQWALQYI